MSSMTVETCMLSQLRITKPHQDQCYAITRKGIEAPDYKWSNPQLTLYPERLLEYFREKRKQHKYFRKAPTKRRR